MKRAISMDSLRNRIVCITGASSGIGAACARVFAGQGAALLLSARRRERVDALAAELRAGHGIRTQTFTLDVRDLDAVTAAFAALPPEWQAIDILVNNAGLARGLHKLHEGMVQDWEEMIDTNIKGLLYVSRTVVPGMVERKRGHVINIGSIAGHDVYPNGNVYCATKHAVAALTQGLKMDLLGTGVRVCSVDPGLVETEFSLVRFHGDAERASTTYKNMRPLHGEDVADVVLFCATRPAHVDISQVTLMPTDQASVHHVFRG
jgi:3-hydroxy acid dehydrogenase/malonic semialdehyde reductase